MGWRAEQPWGQAENDARLRRERFDAFWASVVQNQDAPTVSEVPVYFTQCLSLNRFAAEVMLLPDERLTQAHARTHAHTPSNILKHYV